MSEYKHELDAIVEEFVAESREHLSDIENQILTIEEWGAEVDGELVNKVFRCVHSMKGSAAFIGSRSGTTIRS